MAEPTRPPLSTSTSSRTAEQSAAQSSLRTCRPLHPCPPRSSISRRSEHVYHRVESERGFCSASSDLQSVPERCFPLPRLPFPCQGPTCFACPEQFNCVPQGRAGRLSLRPHRLRVHAYALVCEICTPTSRTLATRVSVDLRPARSGRSSSLRPRSRRSLGGEPSARPWTFACARPCEGPRLAISSSASTPRKAQRKHRETRAPT